MFWPVTLLYAAIENGHKKNVCLVDNEDVKDV